MRWLVIRSPKIGTGYCDFYDADTPQEALKKCLEEHPGTAGSVLVVRTECITHFSLTPQWTERESLEWKAIA